jgi:hypothetical protein
MAPVVADIPGVIVGDENSITAPNLFVYPDAFSLDSKVTDDNVLDANIQWSYTGAGKYRLNNVLPLNLATEDPILPGAKRIDNVDNDPNQVDGNPDTVTFRNVTLSPPLLPNTDPPGSGIIASETQAVTVFASDGSTATMKSFLVYTDDGGNDRLSGSLLIHVSDFVSTGGLGWTSSMLAFETDGSTPVNPTMTDNANGMCIDVPLTGNRLGTWTSPYNIVSLVQNNVFRFRLQMDTAGEILPDSTSPLWDFIMDNFSPASPVVLDNKFSGDYLFYDNLGGANSPSLGATVGRNDFHCVWCPPATTAADWNDATTGWFRPANDANNDIRLAFRVFDTDTSAYGAEFDDGAVCLRSFSVDRIDISALTTQAVLYDVQNMTDGDAGGSHHITTIFGSGRTTVTFAGGNITVAPNTAGSEGNNAWDLEVIELIPGNRIFDIFGNPAETADNFPIDWESNQLVKIEVGAQAPNATGQTNPPDVVRIGMDVPSIELLSVHNVTAALDTIGMPKNGVETVYTAFFYTHNRSISTVQNVQRLRPRFGIINFDGILSGGSQDNLGGIQINFQRVSRVQQPVNFD